ncbi:MAG: hypothetical protein ACHQYP_11175 [Nitrospiria bacterium]
MWVGFFEFDNLLFDRFGKRASLADILHGDSVLTLTSIGAYSTTDRLHAYRAFLPDYRNQEIFFKMFLNDLNPETNRIML